jgi:hypothetical protein
MSIAVQEGSIKEQKKLSKLNIYKKNLETRSETVST